jgi:hypothetical protein
VALEKFVLIWGIGKWGIGKWGIGEWALRGGIQLKPYNPTTLQP